MLARGTNSNGLSTATSSQTARTVSRLARGLLPDGGGRRSWREEQKSRRINLIDEEQILIHLYKASSPIIISQSLAHIVKFKLSNSILTLSSKTNHNPNNQRHREKNTMSNPNLPPLPNPLPPDEDRGPQLIGAFWTWSALSIILVMLRFYARYQLRAIGLDDWMMLITVASPPSPLPL